MAAWRRLLGHFRDRPICVAGKLSISGMTSLALGAVIAVSTGILLIQAGHSPILRETLTGLNKPIRLAVETHASSIADWRVSLPFWRPETQSASSSGINAPAQRPGSPGGAGSLPGEALEGLKPVPAEAAPPPRSNRAQGGGAEPGLHAATNYCVRLCDGFAFPIGRAGTGDEGAHEMACRIACPGAQTALFTMPRGARDFSEAYSPRGGANYSALPTAFRYRERYDRACICRPKGSTQPASALLTDFTLRRGDLTMTRQGMRHFDGSPTFPLRQNQFSDALRQMENPGELQLVRGMEAASLRGRRPADLLANPRHPLANPRHLLATEILQPEMKAGIRRVSEFPGTGPGFEEMRTARPPGPQPIGQMGQRQGLIAMN